MELAEEVLALFYEARDAVAYLRHPLVMSSEIEDIKKAENETEQQWEARKNASVVFKRYNERQELFNRIHSLRYRFMAQIGNRGELSLLTKLEKDRERNIFSSPKVSSALAEGLLSEPTRNGTERLREDREVRGSLLGRGQRCSQIAKRLLKTVADMERYCREVIEGKGTIYYWINLRLGKRR